MDVVRALLLTDVVDSTLIAHALGDESAAQLWTAHDRAARDLLPHWRGREIDKTDGMLLLFESAADAVGYALDYHRALTALTPPLKARAGLHVGPVRLRDNSRADIALGAKPVEVEGTAKPIAARVMAIALGGQTLVSADARLALGVTPWRAQSHGHWRLRGAPEVVELFEVGEAGAPFTPPPDGDKAYRVVQQGQLWLPAREIRHSLPAERDSFVGREEPLQRLAQQFEAGARLVSVLGMGGSGKTRLVTRFAWQSLGDHPGGIWFCDLSPARSVDGIVSAMGQGLDVPLGKADPIVQLGHAIAGRGRCLVILDNFEQVARHAEETLGRWLDRAPQARFIVTTREVLGIVGEEIFALAPLPVNEGVALFMRRAEAAKAQFRVSAPDVDAIHRLVTVLDGLPLAIELAASRVRVMSPRALLARMNERFDVLLSGTHRRDRQATLRAALDWSWELLSEAERAGLAQLSVFDGGFNLTSAEAVIDLSAGASPSTTLDVIQGLIDKSLIRPLVDERFDLLESVREYAAEHLRTEGRFRGSGPAGLLAAQRRHGRFFSARDRSPAGWAGAELENLALACRRAVERGDGEVAVRTMDGAWGCIRLRGPFRTGVELVELVETIRSTIDVHGLVQLDLTGGMIFSLCGQTGQAFARLLAATAAARAVGNAHSESRALNALARLQTQQGHAEEAQSSYERALRMARQAGDAALLCSVLNQFADFCDTRARPADALHHYQEALALAVEHADRLWEGGTAGNLGQFHANQGNRAEAKSLYDRSISIARELGDRVWEANARCNLGLLHLSLGQAREAREELQAVLGVAREMGHEQLVAVALCNLGLVAEALGEPDAARSAYDDAVSLARGMGDHRAEGQYLGYLGLLHARQAEFALAEDCFRRGNALLSEAADKVSLGVLLCGESEANMLAGKTTEASETLARAEVIGAELGHVAADSELGQALQRARGASRQSKRMWHETPM